MKTGDFSRRKTSTTQIRGLLVGSDYPIRIQTMANTSTDDIDQSLSQIKVCSDAHCDLFRFTTQGQKEVESLRIISERMHQMGIEMPLVADVHFRSDVADLAAQVADKVRINPGNYANDPNVIRERFTHFLNLCKAHHTAIRIGVNHGSLSPRMMEKYGDTPLGMVESCMEFLRIAVEEDFHDIVLSIKSSNTRVMVDTTLLLVETMDHEDMHFPIHLGVTEAGEGEDGRIKSAVGIGALLAQGIGDTIRVSLSEQPEAELPVAGALVDYFTNPQSARYQTVQTEITPEHVRYSSLVDDWATFSLQAAAECGALLWFNPFHTTHLVLNNPHFSEDLLHTLTLDILQAAGISRYKTEFTSCPGCGRTMFDLQRTVKEIKQAFTQRPDLQGLKIAVMGCIVNGPGEMADADYGYVGAGRDRISLYRRKECVLKHIPQEQATQALISLIDQDMKNK